MIREWTRNTFCMGYLERMASIDLTRPLQSVRADAYVSYDNGYVIRYVPRVPGRYCMNGLFW